MKYSIKKIEGSKYHYIDSNGVAFIKRDEQLYYKVLSQQVNNGGYYRVAIAYESGIRKYELTHRLVAEAFIKNPSNLRTVNHIDGVKYNNNVDNLEWLSLEDNQQHAKDNHLYTGPRVDTNLYYKEYSHIPKEYTGEFGEIRRLANKYDISESIVRQLVGAYDKYRPISSNLAINVREDYRGKHGDIKRLSEKYNLSPYKVKRYIGKL